MGLFYAYLLLFNESMN